jgi:hypothetical protein
MHIPKKEDWGKIKDIDIERKYAFDMFIGKSFDQALEMCKLHAQGYQEELQSMPKVPFNFYAPVLANYIISPSAKGDSDGANAFLSMVAWMLKTQRGLINPETERILISAARKIAENQEFYEADFEIYGSFKDAYLKISETI